ncbi:DUF2947 domain-containing protein [Marinomonas sp. C2222]|uniref:DUF2947 domain-containing protein n=1 Tax=Marinomonas sargassi TaxID=2984494 RepID=A0ABT2YRY0_9GAMM|nr:DUF2947 domain-containing protein [Marinomonas sargassi]MCV2402642.1 DUF2947 domain-containing protein [Marinomonas sargassi]
MYQPLETFSKFWIFKRDDPKIEPNDLDGIRLLTEQRANDIWRDYISDEQLHPDKLSDESWLNSSSLMSDEVSKVQWEKVWESDREQLPEDFLSHFSAWGEDTKIYFCCHNELIFETTWSIFQRTWKAFLFLDNGPILIGKKKKQAAQFFSSGWCNLLLR